MLYLGDIDKIKAHTKQIEGTCAHRNVVIRKIQK